MGIELSQAEGRSVIQLRGAIDIAVGAELKAVLLEAIGSGHGICIAAGTASVLDVTAFQLLWSAEREAKRAGVDFAIEGALSGAIRSSLACMGLDGFFAGMEMPRKPVYSPERESVGI